MYQEKTGKLTINKKRLKGALQELSLIGRNSCGGLDRQFGSQADRDARSWMVRYWRTRLHLSAEIDPAANLWIENSGSEPLPPIFMGSHLDTVSNGGKYDGALGVLLATELIETIREKNIPVRHPIGVVCFTGEEPNPFRFSALGSGVLAGRLTSKSVRRLESRESLRDALAKAGGNLDRIDEARLFPNQLSAFLECHVEQGRRLFDRDLSIAAVTRITGIHRETVTVRGEANHAGTTVPRDRRDALLAASELNLALEGIIEGIHRDDVVATVGKIEVLPNAANVIPGSVKMTVDIRTCSDDRKNEVLRSLKSAAEKIGRKRRVTIRRKVDLDQPASDMSRIVTNALNLGAERIGEPVTELVSMAGYDSANMSRLTNTGMLFVRSIEGKSRCPEEDTDMDAIEKAGEAMLEALMILDRELDQK